MKISFNKFWWYRQIKSFKHIISLFLITRLAIFSVTYYGLAMFNFISFPNINKVFPDNLWLDAWTRWDAAFFARIATEGYVKDIPTGTFPGYSLLIKIVDLILHNPFLSGIVVSNLAFFIGLVFLYKLVKDKFSEEIAWRAALYLCIFPTSFFFCAALSEATFLMFSVMAFYYAEKEKWWLSGISGALALLTRPVGVAVFLPILLIYLHKKNFNFKQIKVDALAIFLIPLGIIIFMGILIYYGHSPFAFLSGQEAWGRTLAPPWWDLGRAWQELSSFSWPMFLAGNYPVRLLAHFILVILFLALSFFIFKSIGLSYGVYALSMVLIPLSSPSTKFFLYSDLRFILVAFPIFILLGKWGKNKLLDTTIVVFSLLFLALFSIWNGLGGWIS